MQISSDKVFDILDGQDLSQFSAETEGYNKKFDNFYTTGDPNLDIIDVGNQIGSGLVPPSTEFPAANELQFSENTAKFGQQLSHRKNAITSKATNLGINAVIATSIHERGHDGGAPGGYTLGHENLYRKVNKVMEGIGARPGTWNRCNQRGGC